MSVLMILGIFLLLGVCERAANAAQALVDEAREPGITARRAWAAREAKAAKAYTRHKRRQERWTKNGVPMTRPEKVMYVAAMGYFSVMAALIFGGALLLPIVRFFSE